MIIYDFSPNHPNTSGKPERIALNVNKPHQYKTALLYAKTYFNATFPNQATPPDFATAKSYYHGNTKIFLQIFYNDIIGKYEMQITTRKIMKSYHFLKYDFIGNLTDFANK